MATIGHTLVGLSFASFSRVRSRDQRLPYVWIGLMVLMAHLVDVVEWLTVLIVPRWRDGHYLTHSPLNTSVVVVVVCLAVAVFGKVRRPMVFLLIAVAIYSHLLLDWELGRKALADAFGVAKIEAEDREGYPLMRMVVAEIWLYGLLFVEAILLRAPSDHCGNIRARQLSGILAAVCLVAAGTRVTLIWTVAYMVAALHVVLLLRREWSNKLAWGLIPLVPLGICVSVEIYSWYLLGTAWDLRMAKENRAAITMYQRALRVPARSSKTPIYSNIGLCHDYLGELPQAEVAFQMAARAEDPPNSGQLWLAWFYANQSWRQTPFYRPAEASKILHGLLESSARPRVKQLAADILADLERRGEAVAPSK